MINLFRIVLSHPLNRGGKLRALFRVLRWQIASRVMGTGICFPFVGGTRLLASKGMTGATGNWYCGLHEVSEMAFCLHLLESDSHFLDIGANAGSYTVLAAGASGARVTAVEPIPATFDRLLDNVSLNRLGNQVRCAMLGLSDRQGKLNFRSDLDTVNHVLEEGENGPSIEVDVVTLDDLIGDDCPILIKMDVEGHELSVIKGGHQTLGDPRLQAVIMEVNGSGLRYGVKDDHLLLEMEALGFVPHLYNPFSRSLTPSNTSGANLVFVRDRERIESRVKQAPKYTLVNGEI